MQFIPNGPDIPEALLQAHEEGRVVFFCGAGISYPAGLPSFKGLVQKIYRCLNEVRDPIENIAHRHSQFDTTLNLLEHRLQGGRLLVRKALAEVLSPKKIKKGAFDTHTALLQLARCRQDSQTVLRLVTTNFDRLFERTGQEFVAYAAPMLPIPKNSRWDGLVYLHGLLPDKEDDNALHRLVLTSGDFGLAYLTERWAARFVSELFRSYVVCFVGYSINDPVLRYMMDALAADRMRGENTPEMYALGGCKSGNEKTTTREWKAKGVIPILYEIVTGRNSHSVLHKSLQEWAKNYQDWGPDKEHIVIDYARYRPSDSSSQDNFVGRMLWALSHKSGRPAQRFADFIPAPSLKWLDAFSAYRWAPWVALVSAEMVGNQWSAVMFQLARWLLRHLHDPKLFICLTQQGQLHNDLVRLIEKQIREFARLEKERKKKELNETHSHSPSTIPSPLMQALWSFLLTGRVKLSQPKSGNLYHWKDCFIQDGLTAARRLELRELLSPKIALKKPFRKDAEEESTEPQEVDWELVLTADNVQHALRDFVNDRWRDALPFLFDDFEQLLRDALELLSELGETSNYSHRDLPSITPHWQNRGFRDWVILIELLRDAWLAIYKSDPQRAKRIALGWFDLSYPTFKRLALFAASQDDCIGSEQWVGWLVAEKAFCLWSEDTKRETMRLLVLQGKQLTSSACATLEAAIIAGPPQQDIEPEHWQFWVDRSIWLRLAKLREGSAPLSDAALQGLDKLSKENPQWQLDRNERDEFSYWMSGTGDPDFQDHFSVDIAPRKRADLALWLKKPPPEGQSFYQDNWLETCRTRFFHSFLALCDLSQEEFWPDQRWREALQAWSDEGRIKRSWRYAAPLVQKMPDTVLQEIVHPVTQWMEAASKSMDCHELILLGLCQKVLALPLESNTDTHQNDKAIGDSVTEAINHPIGDVTQALFNLWLKRQPGDNDSLPEDIKPFFSKMCDLQIDSFRHARVLLASRLISLFRVDRSWTAEYLLPLFDWERNPIEARAAWQGFLWSPRVYEPLLLAFKSHFLSTADHYKELGKLSGQFVALLTYAALDGVDGYKPEDFQKAIAALPQEGLQEVAQTFAQALEGTGEQRQDYWKNRVHPFWQRVWPKSRELATKRIAESLARLCIAAGDAFPLALETMVDWLQPIEYPSYVVHLLRESGLCLRFPEDALCLLAAILSDQPLIPEELTQCLDAIAQARPKLEQDLRFQRLREHA